MNDTTLFTLTCQGYTLSTMYAWMRLHGIGSFEQHVMAGVTETELVDHLRARTTPDADVVEMLVALRTGASASGVAGSEDTSMDPAFAGAWAWLTNHCSVAADALGELLH